MLNSRTEIMRDNITCEYGVGQLPQFIELSYVVYDLFITGQNSFRIVFFFNFTEVEGLVVGSFKSDWQRKRKCQSQVAFVADVLSELLIWNTQCEI